jgi:hypothetical protein
MEAQTHKDANLIVEHKEVCEDPVSSKMEQPTELLKR